MPTSWLDGKHVVFGEVLTDASKLNVKKLEATGSSSGQIKYSKPATIVESGTTTEQEAAGWD